MIAAGVTGGAVFGANATMSHEIKGIPVAESSKDLTNAELGEIAEQMLDYDCMVTQALDTRQAPHTFDDGAVRDEVQFSVTMTPKSEGLHPRVDSFGAGGVLHRGSQLNPAEFTSSANIIAGTYDNGTGSSPAYIDENEDGSFTITTQFYPRENIGVSEPQIDLFVYTGNRDTGINAYVPCGTMVKNGDNGTTWSAVEPRESDIVPTTFRN